MILIDVSNLMYTGSSARGYSYSKGEVTIHSIPYILHRMAAACLTDPDVIAVFDSFQGRSTLARTDGYKAGRNKNPLVMWEIKVLKELFTKYRIPHVEVYGAEADEVINTICRDFRGKADVYIMSADEDLYANVYDDGVHKCETLTFSSRSYSVNKYNFESVTKYDYNFTDLHKILRGCQSDNIKPMENGKKIYERYLAYVKGLLKRTAGFNSRTMYLSELEDWQILPHATFEAFIEWFKRDTEFTPALEKELNQRRDLVQGRYVEIGKISPRNWEGFNKLAVDLELDTLASIRAVNVPSFRLKDHEEAVAIMRSVKDVSATLFEPTDVQQAKVSSVSLSGIFNVLDKEDEL